MQEAVRFVAFGILAAASGCAQASSPPAPQTAVATTAPAKPAEAKPADTGQKVVCKRVPVVGSNVGTERVCTVRGDSQKSSDGQARSPENAQGRNGSGNDS